MTGFGREEGKQPDTRHARAGSRRYQHRTTDPAPRERARFGGHEPEGAHRGSDPARPRPSRTANRRVEEDADSAAPVATNAPNPHRSAGFPPPLPTGQHGPEPGCSRSSQERSASGPEESPSSLRHLDLQRNALQRGRGGLQALRRRMPGSREARKLRQPASTRPPASSQPRPTVGESTGPDAFGQMDRPMKTGSREPLLRYRKAARTGHPRFGRTRRRAPGRPDRLGGKDSREKPDGSTGCGSPRGNGLRA